MNTILSVTSSHSKPFDHTTNDTEAFLTKILPSTGPYCAAVFAHGLKAPPRHVFKPTVKALAEYVLAADARGLNVFHACASYKTTESRKQANAAAMRAFWLDLDVKPGQYESQRKAAEAVGAFCLTIGLPAPMVVSSGRGLHCYWPLADSIPAAEWKQTAEALALCLNHCGVMHDPSRTTDEASILRPLGTHHRKAEPIPVKLLRDCEPIENARFLGAVHAYAAAHGLSTPRKASTAATSALSAGMEREFPPASFAKLTEQCAAMREAAAIGGGDEPMWRAMLGLIKHCVEGEALAHEISARDARYDPAETQAKYDRYDAGPPTCDYIAQHSGACAACPHRGGAK